MINNVRYINNDTKQVSANETLKKSESSFANFLRSRMQATEDTFGVGTAINTGDELTESLTEMQGGEASEGIDAGTDSESNTGTENNAGNEELLPGTNTLYNTTTTTTTTDNNNGLDTKSLMSTMMELMSATMSMSTMSMLNGSGSGSDGMSSMMNMMMMVLLVQTISSSTATDNSTASAGQVSDAYSTAAATDTMEERAALYADYIDGASAKYGMDSALIKGIIQAESSFDPNDVSSAGAKGLMQLMPETAAEVGVTDPFDPAQNIDGGTHYVKKLIDRYNGDVKLALVAYNHGPGNVDRKGVTSSSDANYETLPKACRDYADRVLAYANNYATATA